MADNEWLPVDQKVKVVLFYAETKSVVVWRMQGFVCKGLWGKTVVELNMFLIRNNFPAYED
jgi:hypothetical protein